MGWFFFCWRGGLGGFWAGWCWFWAVLAVGAHDFACRCCCHGWFWDEDFRGARSGGGPAALRFALLFLEVRSDAVEVVGEHSEADVFFVVCFSPVGAAVESVVLEGVDVAFDSAVFVGLFSPLFVTLAFAVGLAGFAFFGHDDFGDFELQQFAVFDAAEAAVGAEADEFSGGEGAEESVGEGDDFSAFVAAGHDLIVMDEVVLVGGDEEAATEFDAGSAFAFGDPFGVLFEEGKELFSGGDFTSFEEAVAD